MPTDALGAGAGRDLFRSVVDRPFDEVYHFADDMGGANYIFSSENDAAVMRTPPPPT